MTRQNGGAKQLADSIEVILAIGSGPMDISYDDLRVALRRSFGYSLNAAGYFIARHLSTALDILGERGWSAVKTTDYWDRIGHVVPTSEPEIRRCIAGIGKGSRAVGLHFTLGADDWLWVYARDQGARVWRGKRRTELDRLQIEVDAGRLTPSGLAVAESSATDPNIGDKAIKQAMRVVAATLKP